MNQRNDGEFLFIGVLLGFLVIGLMERQAQQNARIRALRKRLAEESGPQIDLENLRNDWRNIESDLKKSAQKVLSAENETR